jgi:hypothetical protein
MASYSQFLGHKVTVQYRAGDILLPASGTLVGDSGRSIFLEQHLEQRGKMNYFRWEIPYQCIQVIEEVRKAESLPPAETGATKETPQPRAAVAAASQSPSSSAASSLLPLAQLPHRPKTA